MSGTYVGAQSEFVRERRRETARLKEQFRRMRHATLETWALRVFHALPGAERQAMIEEARTMAEVASAFKRG